MWEDPIVAEVHRIREKLAAQFNFDVEAIFADMQNRQVALGPRLISRLKAAEPAADAVDGGPRIKSTATAKPAGTVPGN